MMDMYAPRSVGKVFLSALFAIVSVVLLYCAFNIELYLHEFVLMMFFAVVFLGLSFFVFLFSLGREVVLHADEEGILTMYQFYLPWKYVEEIYAKDDAFVEIRVRDNEKYLAEMDRDYYTIFYDEIEANCSRGHELFFFHATFMGHTCEEIVEFLNEARKTYAK